MRQIILIRHGHTEADGKDRVEKNNDLPLTSLGEKQMLQVGLFLKDNLLELPETICSSLAQRTVMSAKLIAQSLSVNSLEQTTALAEYRVGGDGVADTVESVTARVMPFVYGLYNKKTVLIVSHENTLKTILRHMTNMSFRESLNYFVSLGEICWLEYDWEKGVDKWVEKEKFIPDQGEY